jgi:polyribonucleotide nucleotidyltransferase
MKTLKTRIGRHEMIIETGKLAKQADGAVTVQYGGTVVLTTVVGAKEPKEAADFFPLTVDYREKTYAAGKIPGGFFKREGRPTEKEILTSRLIDRPIRPLFPENFLNEVQVMSTVLSVDSENNPDILGVIGTSAALALSPLPFEGPIGAVRVGLSNGALITNPTFAELQTSELDLVVVGTRDKIVMIESGSREISEETLLGAINFGLQEIRVLIDAQEELARGLGVKKWTVAERILPQAVVDKVKSTCSGRFTEIILKPTKEAREDAMEHLSKEVLAAFDPKAPDYNEAVIKHVFGEIEKKEVRDLILRGKKRPDSRTFEDLRAITCEVGLLPRTHGSALFTRGQTQSLAVATLGTRADEQIIDALEGESYKRFMLHYNFPPFSVGEIRPNRGPGRREIGHGALAERALLGVMPNPEEFPYTVRIVSDILESNGSSSMASVCSATLALMDAGVPLKAPVAGIALGLITDGERNEILTDIAGIEDHLGDMDFKVAGTLKGITALQLDIKIKGITTDTVKKALEQGHRARMKILGIMTQVIDKPRESLSQYAPRITVLTINTERIKDVIGPGGKMIKKIIEETGVKIDIEDDGRIFVASADAKASEAAIAKIRAITEEAEVGRIYQAKVRKIMNFGAFCEILPGTDGLVHVSEIADGYVKRVEDHLKVGDMVTVKVISIDDEGRINLSIKKARDLEKDVQTEKARS